MNLVFPLPRALDRSSSSRALAFAVRDLKGLRVESFSEQDFEEALHSHEAGNEVLKRDHRAFVSACFVAGRPVVVKEVTKGGLLRRSADTYRGSPGRRAWLGGHGLIERGIAAALPLAFAESRRVGVPRRSLVILEDLRPASGEFLDRAAETAEDPEALSATLRNLLIRLHRGRVVHGDLQAQHIFLRQATTPGQGPEPVLIDLEGVRFPLQLSDEQRSLALAQLNASIPDDSISARLRREGFERYARELPFRVAKERALASILAQSLQRKHAWKGIDCANATLQEETLTHW